jgi:quercetin dioxygenase-like cupin family protein
LNFGLGVRNRFHSHTQQQVLILTDGKGIVATEKEQVTVGPGDVILIPVGEKHWYGATKSATFSHLHVTSLDCKTTQLEGWDLISGIPTRKDLRHYFSTGDYYTQIK